MKREKSLQITYFTNINDILIGFGIVIIFYFTQIKKYI